MQIFLLFYSLSLTSIWSQNPLLHHLLPRTHHDQKQTLPISKSLLASILSNLPSTQYIASNDHHLPTLSTAIHWWLTLPSNNPNLSLHHTTGVTSSRNFILLHHLQKSFLTQPVKLRFHKYTRKLFHITNSKNSIMNSKNPHQFQTIALDYNKDIFQSRATKVTQPYDFGSKTSVISCISNFSF